MSQNITEQLVLKNYFYGHSVAGNQTDPECPISYEGHGRNITASLKAGARALEGTSDG